jgi:hypothetical protein
MSRQLSTSSNVNSGVITARSSAPSTQLCAAAAATAIAAAAAAGSCTMFGAGFVWSEINVCHTQLVGWIIEYSVGRLANVVRMVPLYGGNGHRRSCHSHSSSSSSSRRRETIRCQQAAVDDMSYSDVMTADRGTRGRGTEIGGSSRRLSCISSQMMRRREGASLNEPSGSDVGSREAQLPRYGK